MSMLPADGEIPEPDWDRSDVPEWDDEDRDRDVSDRDEASRYGS